MSHSALFLQLDTLLVQSRELWQVKAFGCDALPWAKNFPHLAELVWSLADSSLDELDRLQGNLLTCLLPALKADLAGMGENWPLALLDIELPKPSNESVFLMEAKDTAHFSAGIKGRKWAQITAFTQQMNVSDNEVLEWCAGKGHLGRLIAKAQARPVVSVEWQQSLCEAGEKLAQQWQLPQRFICVNAFDAQHNELKVEQQAVALHACGDLHVCLLRLAANAGTRDIAISPCCYHLIQAQEYQAMSLEGMRSQLRLTRHDLQLPLQQSAIVNSKQLALRHKQVAWRLGFDCLQRKVRGISDYLPIPSMKLSQLNDDFATFCLWAAGQKGVNLPSNIDFNYFLNLGIERQRLTQRIDLVAHLFRGVLEYWLLLDRVCFLEEQDYQVNLVQFCESGITPRNSLIQAKK
ncbi:methyltransferase [Shewanella sp. VB17]|uniref:methyltransferase n=1 Tax=Shewanella sp. VB17 TaxID=2739432 RepID=UPI001566EBC8|nr:methyltransferase [Shewanella sp. VB17]NRD74758.1 methyltransferase [Shewanella sp. VB17]